MKIASNLRDGGGLGPRELTMRPEQPKTARGPKTVFVVEPDSFVRASLHTLLRLAGREVETFSTAEEFLSAQTTARPGCLVAEVDLPGLTGLELQERLVQDQIHLPIIFIASRGRVPTAVRALRAGAADFIEKPLVERMLLERIEEILDALEETS